MDEKNSNQDALEKAVWLNTQEAARYLRISPQALRNHVYRGDVPFYKFRRSLRFKRTELDRLLEGTKQGGWR
ncbi:helix-turn-helix domain-containing protein [bacterium]|nr:helix-turn-helix domain-containing protein [bacterium]